ncbi:M48 family metallopeptidase [Jannaschia seohaensis]|nr:M48 family metallopeptidase [Jannaschia seohaensis]
MAPDPGAPVFADYFDGIRALRQRARLRAQTGDRGRVLLIEPPAGEAVRWPVRRIRLLPDQAPGGALAYGLVTGGEARLVVEDEEARDLIERLDPATRAKLPGPPLWRRALMVSAGGVAALAVLLFLVLPGLAGLLARFMDVEAEIAMGEIHYEQTRVFFAQGLEPLRECGSPAGAAALDALTERVAQGVDLPYDLQVAVLDDSARPILNAYAVAGGRIAFFNSMIQAAERPEEIAAILAHEIAHVVNDDPVRHTLQSASGLAVISVLVGDVTGGGLLSGMLGGAIASGYSRDAELAADAFAADQLRSVGLPPSALGEMFQRLRDRYGDVEGLMEHFSTHPALADRIRTADAAGDPPIGRPALTPKQWADLRDICS